ncbi:MAG: TonB family protein [Burkholderiales bacterium]
MRDGASRVLGYAVLASFLLHALLFLVLPAAREFTAPVPPEAEPLVARVEQLEPPPAPAPAVVPEERKPAPQAPVRVVKPAPAPAPVAEPVAEPAPPKPDPVALAPQPSPAQPAPAPTAPAPAPPPALDPRIRSDYAQRINEAAERDKVYPRVAIDNNWQGEVGLVMAIGSDGRIASLRVTKSSGHRVLDDQALEMFARAKPRVRMPAALRGREFELELRAVFRLER